MDPLAFITAECGHTSVMGMDDRIENKAEELKGRLKEGTGKATDDPELETEGKVEQSKSNVKQAAEKAKDAIKNITRR